MPEPAPEAWAQIRNDYEQTDKPLAHICAEHDVTAGRAVPSVGPARGDVLLAAEAHRAVTAATRAHADAGPVEHGD